MSLAKTLKYFACLTGVFAISASFAVTPRDSSLTVPGDTVVAEIFPDDPILAAIDSLWADERLQCMAKGDSACLNVYKYDYEYRPEYNDSILEARLAILDKATPLDLDYNRYVKAFISLYVDRRRDVTARVLGLAELYYPLFEEKLDQFDIPLELKHLAVVESALNASARSRVGATGLWQFMYNTGRIYGLEVDSYIDERSDPYKSTIAACRYMRFLYGMYGDWNMVLAAYNSGPGNVNKAIRRSGGYHDYWKIREYLPRETRSYVPAFIAVNYVMNYATEHNIYPRTPDFVYTEIDTIHVCQETTFDQISHFTNVSTAELALLNPSLKRNFIPESEKCRAVYLPVSAIGLFLANEDSLYQYNKEVPQTVDGFVVEDIVSTYIVRRGDVLGVIAQRNGVRVSQLRAWNNIHGNNIYPGQKIEIRKTVKTKASEADNALKETVAQSNEPAKSHGTKSDDKSAVETYHTIQSGDTLWDIANKYPGVSVNDLKEANSTLNFHHLKPGQKIKIPPAS